MDITIKETCPFEKNESNFAQKEVWLLSKEERRPIRINGPSVKKTEKKT